MLSDVLMFFAEHGLVQPSKPFAYDALYMARYTSRPCDTLGSWAPWPQRRRTCQWTQPCRWRTETVDGTWVVHCAVSFQLAFDNLWLWEHQVHMELHVWSVCLVFKYFLQALSDLSCQTTASGTVLSDTGKYVPGSASKGISLQLKMQKQKRIFNAKEIVLSYHEKTIAEENLVDLWFWSSIWSKVCVWHPQQSLIWESRFVWAVSSRFFMSDVRGSARVASKWNRRLTQVFAITVSTQGLILWMEAATWMLALLLARSSEFSRQAACSDRWQEGGMEGTVWETCQRQHFKRSWRLSSRWSGIWRDQRSL